MKWLIGCLLALVMVSAAFAGEDPYIGIVGNDSGYNFWYFSQKHQQFLFNQDDFDIPDCFGTFPPVNNWTRVGGLGCEQFRSNGPVNQPEICDAGGTVLGVGSFDMFGNPNAVVRKGNAGWFEWFIRLPKKPSGEINICFQCGVLKANAFTLYEFESIEKCAAETGERVAENCSNIQVDPGVNPVIIGALPRITAIAYPGPYNPYANGQVADEGTFTSFKLTAFKNPSSYTLAFDPVTGAMANNTNSQILDGSTNARVLLKGCMDKCIVVKLPVTGQINAAGETEFDLEAGDLIYVKMNIPQANSVDIYCHVQSARIAGIGEAPY